MKAFYKLMLKGTLLGSVAFVMAAAGCSSDKTDNTTNGGSSTTAGKSSAGSPGDAGSGTGGDGTAGKTSPAGGANEGGSTTTPAGGSGEGGASGGAGPITNTGGGPDVTFGGAGGAGGAGTGPSVGKFCNTLTFGTADNPGNVLMVLEVGEGAEKVTFKANSNTCVPVNNAACTTLPQGTAVPIVMYDNDDPSTVLDSGTADIGAGEEWIFFTDLDTSGADPQPIFDGGPLKSAACKDITIQDI